MKGTFKESYSKSNGRTVFVYYLQGLVSELTTYRDSVGKYYREEAGKPLFYTLFYYGNDVVIEKAKIKGNYFVRNDEFDKVKSLTEQFGGDLYQALFDKSQDENWLLTKKNEQLLQTKNIKSMNLNSDENRQTFNNYKGSYAQEIEGYSDQDIDNIFDGDPDMYWNID